MHPEAPVKMTRESLDALLKSNPGLTARLEAPRDPPARRELTTKEEVPRVPYEREEQERLAAWLDGTGLDWYHVPNERASKAEAGKLSRQGVKPGVPDVVILDWTDDGACGLVIELKRTKGGTVSQVQREWLARFTRHGRRAEVCRGADDAIALVRACYSRLR
jgi:hypothetical protein